MFNSIENIELRDLETVWIQRYRSYDKRYGYNYGKTSSPCYGMKQTKETILKRSISLRR